jgi:hypothetical protein
VTVEVRHIREYISETPVVSHQAHDERRIEMDDGVSIGLADAKAISGLYEFPQQTVCASFSFVVTYSDIP